MSVFFNLISVGLVVFSVPAGASTFGFWQSQRTLEVGESIIEFGGSYRNLESVSNNSAIQSSTYTAKYSWQDIQSLMSNKDKVELKNYAPKGGYDPNQTIGYRQVSVEGKEYRLSLGWAYGLTSNYFVGISAPILRRDLEFSEAFVWSESHRYITQNQSLKGFKETVEVRAAKDQTQSETQYGIARSGYYELGDVELYGKWMILNGDENWGISLLNLVRFPAAPTKNPYDGLFVQDDSGQLDLGIGLLVNRFLSRNWILKGRYAYLYQSEDERTVAWKSEADKGNSIVDSFERDLGDVYLTQFGAHFRFSRDTHIGVSWQNIQRGGDRYFSSKQNLSWTGEDKNLSKGLLEVSKVLENERLVQFVISKNLSGENYPGNQAELKIEWPY